MKAEELRIGNYVLQSTGWQEGENGKLRKFNELNFREMLDPDFKLVSGEFEPIPLTEEWLLKLGFKIVGKKTFYNKNIAVIPIYKIEKRQMYMCKGVRLDSIHQLQNLYFALTGTELELKK